MCLAPLVGNVVEITFSIGFIEVDGRGEIVVAERALKSPPYARAGVSPIPVAMGSRTPVAQCCRWQRVTTTWQCRYKT